MLLEIADAAYAVLAPAVSAGTSVGVREIIPRIPGCAVILAHRAPGALAQVGAPKVPERASWFILGEALLFGVHRSRLATKIERGAIENRRAIWPGRAILRSID